MVLPFSTMSSIKGALQRLEKLSMLRRLTMHSARPNMSPAGHRHGSWRGDLFFYFWLVHLCAYLCAQF